MPSLCRGNEKCLSPVSALNKQECRTAIARKSALTKCHSGQTLGMLQTCTPKVRAPRDQSKRGNGKCLSPASDSDSLEDLLAQCDASSEMSVEDREWLDSKPVGNELL